MKILERKLHYDTGDASGDIMTRIHPPSHDERGTSCRIEIGWPSGKETKEVFGIDDVQAVQLAMQMMGAILYNSGLHKAGHLYFERKGNGYGFPVPKNCRDLLEGEDCDCF